MREGKFKNNIMVVEEFLENLDTFFFFNIAGELRLKGLQGGTNNEKDTPNPELKKKSIYIGCRLFFSPLIGPEIA